MVQVAHPIIWTACIIFGLHPKDYAKLEDVWPEPQKDSSYLDHIYRMSIEFLHVQISGLSHRETSNCEHIFLTSPIPSDICQVYHDY
jgi:hypothetical protein